MPTYEYRCQQCQHQLEAVQKMSEAALTTCPSCHNETLTRLISCSAFQLKGEGWYKTDYKKSTPKTETKTETNSTSEKSSSAKTDTSSAGAA